MKNNFIIDFPKHDIKKGTGDDDVSNKVLVLKIPVLICFILKVYHPTLWYYSNMNFILEHCIPRKGVDSNCEEYSTDVSSGANESQQFSEFGVSSIPFLILF